MDEDTPPEDDYDIVGYWVEGIDRECAPTPPEESILLRKRRRKPRAIDNAPPWADITIYESPVLVMAMRDVGHILKLKTQCGNPNGLHIITAATRYDFKNDNWSNPAYVPNDEAAAFIRQWKAYRAKLDGYDIAVAMDDRNMDILEMRQAAHSALPPDGYRSEEFPF